MDKVLYGVYTLSSLYVGYSLVYSFLYANKLKDFVKKEYCINFLFRFLVIMLLYGISFYIFETVHLAPNNGNIMIVVATLFILNWLDDYIFNLILRNRVNRKLQAMELAKRKQDFLSGNISNNDYDIMMKVDDSLTNDKSSDNNNN